MKFLKKLDHNLWTALIIFAIAIIGFCASCFLISGEHRDIPFGFLLSGGVIVVIHLMTFFLEMIDRRRGTYVFTILSITIRFLVLLVSLVFVALMSYQWDIKLFNMFVFVGMYTAGIIVFCLSFILRKDGKEQDANQPSC